MPRLFKEELDNLIERELIYQDALHKLEKNQKTLDKLKVAANKEFDKRLSHMVKAFRCASLEEFKDLLTKQGTSVENLRRSAEREFISTEYVRSLIGMRIVTISHQDVCDYYEQHLNEFQTVDTVKWQNIFILVGPNHPTAADAHRFAEELVARARHGEDFDKLLPFDDGDSYRYRKGEGLGRHQGKISPPEVEPYLFKMKDGEIGPLVELATGVHIFRLLKREYAGVRPFDEKVQQEILIRLRNEMAGREYRRIIRDLKARSVVEFEKDAVP